MARAAAIDCCSCRHHERSRRCFRRCAALKTGCQLGSIVKGATKKNGNSWDRRLEAMRDLVKLLAEEHEVAVEDLLFSGNVQASSTSESVAKPGLSWLLAAIITRKSCVLSPVLAHSWQPIGCGNVFSILLLSCRRILGKFHRLKIL